MILGQLIAGLCLLFLGRRLFWLFVGAVGFVLGMDVAALLAGGMPHSEMLLIALVGGVVGAVLARALEELMVGIAGFMAGAYIAGQIVMVLMPYPGRNIWLAMLVGGIVGTLLLVAVFNWALIALSSLIGASLILHALPGTRELTSLGILVLAIVGMIMQARLAQRGRLPRSLP